MVLNGLVNSIQINVFHVSLKKTGFSQIKIITDNIFTFSGSIFHKTVSSVLEHHSPHCQNV